MDSYFKTDIAVHRLFNEWKKHPKLIIACDFDETVFDTHNRNTDHSMVIEILKKCKTLGFYITLWTASNVERYPMMREFLKSKGVEIDGINENVIELPYGNNKKIYANIFLDDRAGLGQAYTTLATVIHLIDIENQSISDENNEVQPTPTPEPPIDLSANNSQPITIENGISESTI
jgi:hydroxymethylpyrimidine pyrophosphatase-like HAD family hydrolase